MVWSEQTGFESSPLYRTALQQLDGVARRLGLDTGIHERLRHPRRALLVSVPTVMDDGRTEVFAGYRVHHNTVLGPTKGSPTGARRGAWPATPVRCRSGSSSA